MASVLIALRLTPAELQAIDDLVQVTPFTSRSDFIINAIHVQFDANHINTFTALAVRAERLEMRKRRVKPQEGNADAKKETPSESAAHDGLRRVEERTPTLFHRPGRSKKPRRRPANAGRNAQAKDHKAKGRNPKRRK